MSAIDLNQSRSQRAARREGKSRTIPVHIDDRTFSLPAELPAAVIDRVLDPEMEISVLLIEILKATQGSEHDGITVLVDTLTAKPNLPIGFVRGVYGALSDLFGMEQWQQFLEHKPSLQDVIALIGGLLRVYGTDLGESFASLTSSQSGGTTPNGTSNASTASISAASTPIPEVQGSSAGGG